MYNAIKIIGIAEGAQRNQHNLGNIISISLAFIYFFIFSFFPQKYFYQSNTRLLGNGKGPF